MTATFLLLPNFNFAAKEFESHAATADQDAQQERPPAMAEAVRECTASNT